MRMMKGERRVDLFFLFCWRARAQSGSALCAVCEQERLRRSHTAFKHACPSLGPSGFFLLPLPLGALPSFLALFSLSFSLSLSLILSTSFLPPFCFFTTPSLSFNVFLTRWHIAFSLLARPWTGGHGPCPSLPPQLPLHTQLLQRIRNQLRPHRETNPSTLAP